MRILSQAMDTGQYLRNNPVVIGLKIDSHILNPKEGGKEKNCSYCN